MTLPFNPLDVSHYSNAFLEASYTRLKSSHFLSDYDLSDNNLQNEEVIDNSKDESPSLIKKNMFLTDFNKSIKKLKTILLEYLEKTNDLFIGPESVPPFLSYLEMSNREENKILQRDFIIFIRGIIEDRGVSKDDDYYLYLFAYYFLKPEFFD